MSRRLRTIMASASALLQFSSAEPADPTITTPAVLPRQNTIAFIGYLRYNSTWSSVDCNPGLRWYTSGEYGQCCPETLKSCYAATACFRGSQIYTYPDISSVSTIACTDNYEDTALSICNTATIFENTQDPKPRTQIACGRSALNWSYYRYPPADAIATTSSTSEATSSAPVGSAQTSTPGSGSKAWIAGAVVGPILGLAILGAGVWLFLRRKRKAGQLPQHGGASMAPVNPNQPPAGVGGYTDAKPQFHPAQSTYHDQPGQYPQQGGFSPAPQYGFQSPDRQSGAYSHHVKHEGIGGTAELGGSDNEITGSSLSAPGGGPVSELSGADKKQPEEGASENNKPQ